MHDMTLFESEQSGDTMIVMPMKDMGEFEMASIAAGQPSAFDQLVQLTDGFDVVLDLSHTDYFGSSTIGLFNRLVSHVHAQSRKIAFCNLSEHEKEVINITHINRLWDMKASRDEALEYVAAKTPTRADHER
jgi:anti-anti-sigma factor